MTLLTGSDEGNPPKNISIAGDIAILVGKPINNFPQVPSDQRTATIEKALANEDILNINTHASSEISTSLQMYSAHRVLRSQELSDPDDEINRQTLQTMVLKAILSEPHVNAPQ